MPLRTLIIDDEPIALEKLRKYVEKTPLTTLAAACGNALEAMEVIAEEEVDLIITDINMPDLSGMDFIKSLRGGPMVIFTTAYAEYAVDSYRVSAVDYLLKPYGYADFHRAVSKAVALRQSQAPAVEAGGPSRDGQPPVPPESLFVKTDCRYVRIALSDIRYIKGYGEYLQIFVKGRPMPLVTLSSFAAIKERLSADFLQIHRSFIVNMNCVEHVERNRVVMDAETFLPVGDSYRNTFLQYLSSHAVGKASR